MKVLRIAGGLSGVRLNMMDDLAMGAGAVRQSASSSGCDSPTADNVADVRFDLFFAYP